MWTSLQFQNCTPITSICSSINLQLCLGCDLHLWIALWVSFDVCKLYTFCVTLWHTLASDYTGTWLYLMWLILLQSLTLVHAAFCLEIVARLSGLDFWCDDLKLVCNLHMTWKLCVSFMYLVFGAFFWSQTRHDAVCSGSLTGKIRPIIQSCTSVINIY